MDIILDALIMVFSQLRHVFSISPRKRKKQTGNDLTNALIEYTIPGGIYVDTLSHLVATLESPLPIINPHTSKITQEHAQAPC